MKKVLFVVSLFVFPFVALACGQVAREHRHDYRHHVAPVVKPPVTPVVKPTSTIPVISPKPTSTLPIVTIPSPKPTNLQFGFFQPPAGVENDITMEFTDGAFIGNGNDAIFIEPPMNDQAVLAGQFDQTLKSFAVSAAKYPNVILVLGEEENCQGNNDAWSVGYDGNTLASSIQTIQHEASVARSADPNIKIAQDWNADDCGASTPLTSYYAGSSSVDYVFIDGFNFGGLTWDQVFDASLSQLGTLGKPLWIGSEGSVDNKSKFITDTFAGAKRFGIQGVLYFDSNSGGGDWQLDSAALSTLEALHS